MDLPREILRLIKSYLDPEELFHCIEDLDVIEFLLSFCLLDVSYVYKNGWTLMTWACSQNNIKLVKRLLKRKEINLLQTETHYRRTPMHVCAYKNHLKLLSLLVSSYPDLVDERTFFYGCERNYEKVCQLLLPYMKTFNANFYIYTCLYHNIELFQSLRSYGCPMNIQNSQKKNLLMYACVYHCYDIVKILLEEKLFDINEQDSNGMTALMYACDHSSTIICLESKFTDRQEACLQVLQILLEKGADTEIKNNNHMTALMMASAIYHNYEATRLLLQLGADIHAQDDRGWNCLMFACRSNHFFIARMFIEEFKINVNQRNHALETSLIMACRYKRADIFNLLINTPNIDLNAQDNLGNTALIWACQGIPCCFMIKALIKKNADLTLTNYNHLTAYELGTLNKIEDWNILAMLMPF